MLLMNECQFELLTDISVIFEIESSIRGGITTVVKGKVTWNNPSLW